MNGLAWPRNNFPATSAPTYVAVRNDPAINDSGVFGDPAKTILPIDSVLNCACSRTYEGRSMARNRVRDQHRDQAEQISFMDR